MNTSYVGLTSDHSSHRELMKTQVMVREGQSFGQRSNRVFTRIAITLSAKWKALFQAFDLHFLTQSTKPLWQEDPGTENDPHFSRGRTRGTERFYNCGMTTQQVSNEAGDLGPPRYEWTFSIRLCYGYLGTTVLRLRTADLVQPWSLQLRGEVVYEAGIFPLFVFKFSSWSERLMRPAHLPLGEECWEVKLSWRSHHWQGS